MTIIWDWNGTLLDDAEMAVRVTNEVFTRYGYGTMDMACYRERFCFPVKDYYLACGVPADAFPEVGKAWSDAYVASFPGTPLRQDSAETVRRFQAAGLHQLILSASKRELLAEQVGIHPELAGMFDALLGIDHEHAALTDLERRVCTADEIIGARGVDDVYLLVHELGVERSGID